MKYETQEFLGEGTAAYVKKCFNRENKSDILAVKIMRCDDEEKLMAAEREFLILKELKHKNII
mgnify:CR=1 FL=1